MGVSTCPQHQLLSLFSRILRRQSLGLASSDIGTRVSEFGYGGHICLS